MKVLKNMVVICALVLSVLCGIGTVRNVQQVYAAPQPVVDVEQENNVQNVPEQQVMQRPEVIPEIAPEPEIELVPETEHIPETEPAVETEPEPEPQADVVDTPDSHNHHWILAMDTEGNFYYECATCGAFVYDDGRELP